MIPVDDRISDTPPFDTVLVANRGEIARRVIRTLRRLGIRSVAVYSDADADAPHVREADAAYRIGPAAASASYLDVDAVIEAARRSGAQAVHPGYGFLSENVAFARACGAAGIVFIGPGERALEVMGDKIRSKAHVQEHGVPTVPGFSAAGMTDAEIERAAAAAGYPLLIKPSAGGGGKGMQVVRSATELPDALITARRIAAASFGDDTLLLERLIERPRHIEVQVLADARGTVIHLGERECTLQRRHQKVIEEAPSPVVDAGTRARLGEAACAAAASVDYRGAGTVEFLVAGDRPEDFFFIEMNTRLQVEHPVTELVTGVDLVEEQVRIAAGQPLGLTQNDVRLDGHAIEARVYAESPARGFLPAAGPVRLWRAADAVRTDAAVETGSVVSADYDPMIAKVIAHGADRHEALARLDSALGDTVVLGVDTNLGFLRTLLADPAVQAGELDTGLIDRLPAYTDPPPGEAALNAAAALRPESPGRAHASALWRAASGWRASLPAPETLVAVLIEDGEIRTVTPAPSDAAAVLDDEGWAWVHADGSTHRLRVLGRREAMEHRLRGRDAEASATAPELRAPMPGAVVAVHQADGAHVRAGERVLTIEAMKMEHPVLAPHDGILSLAIGVGDQVRRDQIIAHVSAEPGRETS
ncbi:biotin carboxylase N-terminal domain-containing protein [Microbacterium sp. NPDC064584]|uniref:acetyl/propionyl/methylcrotonyl-CoA carboxylase subunit alpha n=1 Tax=Microbacterium sp. NPDC064584 TaxID=3155817 RepID=UPI00341798E8